MDLFKVLQKYGLKILPHKCQFFKTKIVYMGLEFQVETRAFNGMVNFLSSFLPNLRRLLIPIYDLQKKSKKFKWTEKVEKAVNDIKELLISPLVLKAPMPDGLFHLVILLRKVWVALYYRNKETNG